MRPRDIKIGLRNGTLTLKQGKPHFPKYLSPFQKKRIANALDICDLYFGKKLTVKEIADRIGRRHQRVCQILALGAEFLLDAGYIVQRSASNQSAETG